MIPSETGLNLKSENRLRAPVQSYLEEVFFLFVLNRRLDIQCNIEPINTSFSQSIVHSITFLNKHVHIWITFCWTFKGDPFFPYTQWCLFVCCLVILHFFIPHIFLWKIFSRGVTKEIHRQTRTTKEEMCKSGKRAIQMRGCSTNI